MPVSQTQARNKLIEMQIRIAKSVWIWMAICSGVCICLLAKYLTDTGYLLGEEPKHADPKVAALSQAKDVGLAIVQVAKKNSYKWPERLGSNLLKGYLRSPDDLIGFVYLLPREAKVQDTPDSSIIGYVQGPGGRAVVYADTSAHWKADSAN